jgi:transposase
MSERRKRYSCHEKAKVALESIKGELTLSEITTKYGIHASQINIWKKQALTYLVAAFNDKSKRESVANEAHLAELYEQIGRLKVENEFLKKKSELFRG